MMYETLKERRERRKNFFTQKIHKEYGVEKGRALIKEMENHAIRKYVLEAMYIIDFNQG